MKHLERFSFECGKTETKVITLTNYNRPATDVNSAMNQSEFEETVCNQRQAWENACGQVTIGFGTVSHWLKKWREFC